jgi:peptidoglycan/LPS O-acetylase OafA/YrhL
VSQSGRFRAAYWPSLDGVRGIAVLIVMLFHAGVPHVETGPIGVDLFFVLSGLLITSLLIAEWERTGTIRLRQFYARRALRLVPALMLMLVTGSIYAAIRLSEADAAAVRHDSYFAAVYLTNLATARHWLHTDWLNHTWSLSVEEQFYILWPPILWTCVRVLGSGRRQRLSVIAALCALFATAAVARPWLAETSIFGTGGLDTRGDGLLLGCVAGLLVSWNLLPVSPRALALLKWTGVVAGAFLAYMVTRPYYQSVYLRWLSAINLAAVLVYLSLLVAPLPPVRWFLETKPLVWIGRRSYGIYLWHYPMFGAFPRVPSTWPYSNPKALVIRFAFAIIVAALSYAFVERPCLRLKRRFGSVVAEAAPTTTSAVL